MRHNKLLEKIYQLNKLFITIFKCNISEYQLKMNENKSHVIFVAKDELKLA